MKLYKYLLILLATSPFTHANSVLTEQMESNLYNEGLHSGLIQTAIQFDVFNQRCRGVSMAKKLSNVNRLFLSKYDITVNNYIKVYLSQDPRVAKKRLKQEMVTHILKQGGCRALKKQGTRKLFKKHYRELFQQTELSAWIPQKTRKR